MFWSLCYIVLGGVGFKNSVTASDSADLQRDRVDEPYALSEGWAESDELQRALEEARRQNLRGPWEAIVRVNIAGSATVMRSPRAARG